MVYGVSFDGKCGVFDAYFRKNQIPDPPIFHPDRLYIGNAFCPHLAPKEEELFALMDKACRESFAVTLVFPFLLEENLSETQARLQHLARWCEQENKTIEIVVNDWGTAHLAAQFPVFSSASACCSTSGKRSEDGL